MITTMAKKVVLGIKVSGNELFALAHAAAAADGSLLKEVAFQYGLALNRLAHLNLYDGPADDDTMASSSS